MMKMRLLLLLTALASSLTLGLTGPDSGGPALQGKASTLSPQPIVASPAAIVTEQVVYVNNQSSYVNSMSTGGGLIGQLGHASPFGNCVLEPGVKIQPGNPISWRATTSTPYIGATALWTYNHTGVVVGIWSNGDLEIAHQNYRGGQHRFSRSAFRGFI